MPPSIWTHRWNKGLSRAMMTTNPLLPSQNLYPGAIIHVDPGKDPVHTALSEIYQPPLPGFGPRGGDVDSAGVYWVSLASGHLGRFDRRHCKVLNGPTATGKHCPEGWTLYPLPGPQFKDVKGGGSAEGSYYVWTDRFDVMGLGKDTPFVMGNLKDRKSVV